MPTKPKKPAIPRKTPTTSMEIELTDPLTVALYMTGHTQKQIADMFGLCHQAISNRLSRLGFTQTVQKAHILEEYRKKKIDVLTAKEMELMAHMTPKKMDRAGLSQLAMAFGIMDERGRLERGMATQNVGVVGVVLDLRAEIEGLARLAAAEAVDTEAGSGSAPEACGSSGEQNSGDGLRVQTQGSPAGGAGRGGTGCEGDLVTSAHKRQKNKKGCG